MSVKKQFAKNLHRAISMRGIKQVELAEAIQVPPTTLSGWMRGSHLPDLDKLLAICNYLDIPVGELMGDKFNSIATEETKCLRETTFAQQAYIKTLEEEIQDLNKCISDLREGLGEDNSKNYLDAVKTMVKAGVKEITIKF